MFDNELEELVMRKKNGEEGLDDSIMGRIALNIFENPRMYGLKDRDDAGELFDRYWERIQALPSRYLAMGYTFNSFLYSSVRYMAMSLKRKRLHTKRNFFETNIEEAFVREPSAVYTVRVIPRHRKLVSCFPRSDDRSSAALIFRQRLMMLCMRCAFSLSDDDATAIAESSGMDVEELLHNMKQAREKGSKKIARIEAMKRGRDIAWICLRDAEQRLPYARNSYERDALLSRIAENRRHYTSTLHRLAQINTLIANTHIARILKMPKGTVDGSMRRIVKMLPDILQLKSDEDGVP